MTVYKFCDKVDGNFAFVAAKSEKTAWEAIKAKTALDVELVETKPIDGIEKPIIFYNKIIAF